jgi:hypothetical protein
MRSLFSVFAAALSLGSGAFAQTTPCVGLACQQMLCPAGSTTSVSGIVYAPNGTDPLPNVQVYVPNASVAAFTPGVSCPVVGQPPSGSPLVGATTAVDGSFTIPDMPVGTNIPLVIASGRWRRQLVIPTVTACTNTPLPSAPVTAGSIPTAFAVFPSNQSQGDIPKIAVATGEADSVECVLRKVGIADSEFTDPGGNSSGYIGRVNFFLGSADAGATIDGATPSEASLMSTAATLNNYDVLMLPCEGEAFGRTSTELQNLASFANVGGRVYASHYAYSWMDTPQTFNTVADWTGTSANSITSGTATVNAAFSGGATLSTWLTETGASTTPGQIALSTIRTTQTGINAPTQSWLTLNDAAIGNPTMQFVWDTPISTAAGINQCGRVLFNEYHVENPAITPTGRAFPTECAAIGTPLTPQEKLLEYSLFELTNDGGAATLAPTTQAFGSAAIGFNSAPQSFTWTNNSTFSASVTLLTGSPDFNVTGNNCTSVPAYSSCTITMVFNPSMLGAETGLLTVGSNGTTLTAALTGTGVPDLTLSTVALNFGSLDVGASLTQTISATNSNAGPVGVPPLVVTGDYAVASNCGSTLAAGATCAITVTFKPSATGSRPGTLTLQSAAPGTPTALSGNGIDFTITSAPASGTVIAGYGSSTVLTSTPLAGFAANVTLSCATNAPASTCVLSSSSFALAAAITTNVAITTTSQYSVIGYGGVGGSAWLSLLGLGAGLMLWTRRRSSAGLLRSGLTVCLLLFASSAAMLGLNGCSGKLPGQNSVYTNPGTYSYTVTATDGFLVHSATYSLNVTAK